MRLGENSLVWSQVAPVGGWNSRDPLPTMESSDAIALENLIPEEQKVSKRKGYEQFCDFASTSAVESLFSYNAENGTPALLAAKDNDIYTITTGSAVSSAWNTCSITNNVWQHTQFGGYLHLCNGDSPVCYYPDGSSKVAPTTWTNDTNMINVGAYNERLYFIKKDSTSLWYGGTKVVATGGTPALTEYPLSSILNKGGYLVACGSSSNNSNNINSDLFIVVSSEGELLAFQGSYPGSTTWSLGWHFHLPRPIGYRCLLPLGSDLQLITEGGIISVSAVLSNSEEMGKYSTTTDKIDPSFNNAALSTFATPGWEAVFYPKRNLVIVNTPTVSGYDQYVMNTQSRGWCKFTGIEARTWCVSDGLAYFGGSDGKVYKFGEVENDAVTSSSNGVDVPIYAELAYTDCGSPLSNKLFTSIMPIIKAVEGVTLKLGANIDYSSSGLTYPTGEESTTTVASWDEAEWDVAEWPGRISIQQKWYTTEGVGFKVSTVIEGSIKDAGFELYELYYLYKKGGIL